MFRRLPTIVRSSWNVAPHLQQPCFNTHVRSLSVLNSVHKAHSQPVSISLAQPLTTVRGMANATAAVSNFERVKGLRVNEKIGSRFKIRLVAGEGDTQVTSLDEAILIAKDKGLDLVQVTAKPNAKREIICKLMNYQEALDEAKNKDYLKKKERKQQLKDGKKSKILAEKEVRVGSSIGEGDFKFKIDRARKFLDKGHVVTIQVELRRSKMDQEERAKRALELIDAATESLQDIATEIDGSKKVMLGQIRSKYRPLKK